MVFSLMPPTGRILPVRETSPVMARLCRTGRSMASESRAVTMVQPALGPSLGVAPWKGGAGGWQADPTGRWSRSCQGPGGPHLGHVQVKVRRHQVLVAGVVLHQEGPGEGVGDAGALLHHVPQLACHLQAPVLVPMAVLLLWPSWRCLDEQRGASWRPVRRDHERWECGSRGQPLLGRPRDVSLSATFPSPALPGPVPPHPSRVRAPTPPPRPWRTGCVSCTSTQPASARQHFSLVALQPK